MKTREKAAFVSRTGGSERGRLNMIVSRAESFFAVRVRRSGRAVDLRNLPLDGFDMFLLAQLDSTASVAELIDIAPCDRAETLRRLFQLARFQVVDLSAETADERAELARQVEPAAPVAPPKPRLKDAAVTQKAVSRPRPDFDEESTTLRPPPDKRRKAEAARVASARAPSEEATTLRPPKPLAVQEMMKATEDSTVRAVIDRSSGVVEKQPLNIEFRTPREAMTADGHAVNDRSVFSRQTLVDEDSESRARQLEEPVPARRR
jgi:hypothetical protein